MARDVGGFDPVPSPDAEVVDFSKIKVAVSRRGTLFHRHAHHQSKRMDASPQKLGTFSRLRYQYEVTFGLYMLTTIEKIILSTDPVPRATTPLFRVKGGSPELSQRMEADLDRLYFRVDIVDVCV